MTPRPEDKGPARILVLRKASEIRDDKPTWMWTSGGRGRMAVGTMVILGGRPGAGKSSGARYFGAKATLGELEGAWLGQPVNVAYIGAEESAKYIVKPGLRAAGADMDRVFFPEVTYDGEHAPLMSSLDMDALTRELVANDVRLVIVDPLMSTLGAKTDINRNNEVRALLDPWRKLAERVDGVVIGVAHLNKSGHGDVVAGLIGSSAFGEVARAIFGFAKDPESEDGARIMSQEKNSLGDEDLALTYAIESCTVHTDDGGPTDVGRFVIRGPSDRTVGDVLRTAGAERDPGEATERDNAKDWLRDYLADRVVDSIEAKRDGENAGFSVRTLQRARSALRVQIRSKGRQSTWELPNRATDSGDEAQGTGGTNGTGPGQVSFDQLVPSVPPVPHATRIGTWQRSGEPVEHEGDVA